MRVLSVLLVSLCFYHANVYGYKPVQSEFDTPIMPPKYLYVYAAWEDFLWCDLTIHAVQDCWWQNMGHVISPDNQIGALSTSPNGIATTVNTTATSNHYGTQEVQISYMTVIGNEISYKNVAIVELDYPILLNIGATTWVNSTFLTIMFVDCEWSRSNYSIIMGIDLSQNPAKIAFNFTILKSSIAAGFIHMNGSIYISTGEAIMKYVIATGSLSVVANIYFTLGYAILPNSTQFLFISPAPLSGGPACIYSFDTATDTYTTMTCDSSASGGLGFIDSTGTYYYLTTYHAIGYAKPPYDQTVESNNIICANGCFGAAVGAM